MKFQPWQDYVAYDETSPSHLRWSQTVGRGGSLRQAGDIAGSISKFGDNISYWRIGLHRTTYFNHRIIWHMFNGAIPNGLVINHIDNNPLNNKIHNLELVTQKGNSHRSSKHNGRGLGRLNTSGFLGVSDSIREINGVIYCYAHAQFRDRTGKKVQKYFRYFTDNVESREKAFEEAIQWRKENLLQLVELGLAFYNKENL
jgi:hypothetical protein